MTGIEQEAKTEEAPQPLDLSVTAGDHDGSLAWPSHPLRGSSGIEISGTATPNDPASWISHGSLPQSSSTITGLPRPGPIERPRGQDGAGDVPPPATLPRARTPGAGQFRFATFIFSRKAPAHGFPLPRLHPRQQP